MKHFSHYKSSSYLLNIISIVQFQPTWTVKWIPFIVFDYFTRIGYKRSVLWCNSINEASIGNPGHALVWISSDSGSITAANMSLEKYEGAQSNQLAIWSRRAFGDNIWTDGHRNMNVIQETLAYTSRIRG